MQAGSLTRLLDLPGDLARILPFLLAGRPSGPTAQLVMAACHGADVDPAGEDGWISFLVSAQRAAAAVGIPARQGAQVVAAMKELASNVAEHSGAPETGMVAFRAAPPGRFEFAVADRGKGVLESLRTSSDYAGLASHAQALRLALEEGVSRLGRGTGRGNGFRPIFAGLADMKGHLRFRSGDHALSIDGRFELKSPALAQKGMLPGFIAMVSCAS